MKKSNDLNSQTLTTNVKPHILYKGHNKERGSEILGVRIIK